MIEAIKLLYVYLLEYNWHVHDQYWEGEQVVITLATNDPYATPFKMKPTSIKTRAVRLSPFRVRLTPSV